MKSILFPFFYETDFKAGYAWSFELATRLKAQLSIFTAIPAGTSSYYSKVYENLIEARRFHIRRLGVLSIGKKPSPVMRHIAEGEFDNAFLDFTRENKFDVLVLPAKTMADQALVKLINSGTNIIQLAPSETGKGVRPQSTREAFFLEIFHRANCYNLPPSFYKSVSEDKSLFNSIASFFKGPELDRPNFSPFRS